MVLVLFGALHLSAQNEISVANIRYPKAHTVSDFEDDQDDLELPSGYFHYRLGATTTVDITGIVPFPEGDGLEIVLSNTSDYPITLKHESDSSTAANRFNLPGNADLILNKGQRLKLFYDGITSRWATYGTGIGIGGLAPPASVPTNVSFAVTGSTSADVSWLQSGADFAMVLLSENPIANLPVDGVLYTADTVYGAGSDLGDGVYVVAIMADESQPLTTVSVSISNLTEATTYYAAVVSYNINGAVALYNRTVSTGNSGSFTTNASESTPTVPYTITQVLTKEDSVIIYGVAGNGAARAVLMAEGKEVDAFFEDDQGYSADKLGQGTEVGTGNYVVFNGVTESPLRLAGFARDKAYSNPYIAEYSSNKFLLPPANGPPEFPSLLRTAWFFDEQFEASSASVGQTLLQQEARVFYDFTQFTDDDGDPVQNGSPGLVDYSGNGYTATIVGTPTVEDLTIGEVSGVKTLGASGQNAVTTGHTGTAWVRSDFRVTMAFWISDGQTEENQHLFGVQGGSGGTSQFWAILAGATNSELNIRFRTPSGDSRWDSDNTALLADGPGFYVLEIEYDFGADAVTVLLNGLPVAGDFVNGLSDVDPTQFAPDQDFVIGSANISGTIQTNTVDIQVVRFAITDPLSSQESSDVRDYFDFLPSGAGTGLARWEVVETNGFDWSVSNDSLVISGTPTGFGDYIITKEPIPDSLFEFQLEMVVTIDDDLETGDVGIALALRNDLSSEPNRGVYGLFITNPASNNFGRAQLYSGAGEVNPTFSFRTQSNGQFTPAKDSSYALILKRDIQGNDVLYSFTIYDLYDSSSVTIGWTESNRPSDAYVGTTMHPAIYVNGGPFRIRPFAVRRTGSEVGDVGGGDPEPDPDPPFEADVYVETTGNDSGDCTQAQPCKSLNRGLQRAGELSPSIVDVFVGAGTYVETSFLNPPANVGEVRGAGRNSTFITGASNLYTSTTDGPSRSGDARALVTINNKGNVSMKFKSMSFMGNKNNGGTTNSIRHCFVINNTHGVVLEDVAIRFFNTTGLKLGNVDDFRMENFYMESTAGEQVSGGNGFTYYQVQTYNIGGGTPAVDKNSKITDLSETNYRVIFKNGLIEGQKSLFDGDAWSDGAGWGLTGGGSSDTTRYVTNVLWENVEFKINKKGVAQHNGHRFNIEGLYMKTGNILLKDCTFNNNLSWGGLSDINSTLGPTRVTGCTFNLNPDPPTFVIEMQISYVEIDHCFVDGARNGVFVSLNVQNDFSKNQPAMWPVVRGAHGHWDIHHNIIRLGTSSNYGMFGGANWELHDYKIRQNTIEFTTTQSVTSNPNWYAIFTDNTPGSTSTGLVYENNAFLGIPPSPSQFWDTGGMSGGIHRNNKSGRIGSSGSPFVVTTTRSGVTSSNNQIHSTGSNTLGLGLGTVPTTWDEAFNGNYYRPQTGSVLINAGHGGVTIGALEPN